MAFPPKELSQEGSFLAGEFMNNYKHVEFNLTQLEFKTTFNVHKTSRNCENSSCWFRILWGYEPRRGLEESETNKPPAMRVRIER